VQPIQAVGQILDWIEPGVGLQVFALGTFLPTVGLCPEPGYGEAPAIASAATRAEHGGKAEGAA
jgi:hypothetical protein